MFLRTERLFLRPAWLEDAPELTRAIGQEPVVRMINGVLFALLAGDLEQLEKLFEIDGVAQDKSWSVTLKAREPGLAKAIGSIALDGGVYVKNIVISEASGDRTDIVFSAIQTGDGAMSADEAALF